MKTLIAEDDVTSRLVLATVLQKWGYEVAATSDGAEAWAALQAEDAPRLAILDWMMPGMDGIEVCRRARQMDSKRPPYLILLTALGRKEDIVTGLNAGANDYVIKPFDNSELRARVEVGRRVVELQCALEEQIEKLQAALVHIKTLQGLLPICMHCHKIRTDNEVWQRMEKYIEGHSEATFSHGICPQCLEKYYPEKPNAEHRKEGKQEFPLSNTGHP